ncbi:c-type cytochrome [Wenzhouxiangella sp. EGI_FJ10409]|uniref:c-type cytochrome n=1 Tax=Wenzhouxiangella sp. EGI_FJ10409 TaxID=3243767 RepID=UPI0035E195A0
MRIPMIVLVLSAGILLADSALAADATAGETQFKQLCATCHGPSGQGDGPASASLNPKPRDLSSSEWQESVDDAHIRTVITEGGPAVGLSPMMTAFGHLGDGDIDNLVAYIRSLDD